VHPLRRRLVTTILVGGPLVLGSYALGAVAWPDSLEKMWGGVPEGLRPLYTGWMFAAAAGFFAFSELLVLRVDPDRMRVAGGHGHRFVRVAYAAIIFPSALWLPATKWYLDAPSGLRFAVVWADLALVAMGSLGVLAAATSVRPRPRRARRVAAIVGAAAFSLQTVVLDALVWPLFMLGSGSRSPLG